MRGSNYTDEWVLHFKISCIQIVLAMEFFSPVSWANHPINHNQATAEIGQLTVWNNIHPGQGFPNLFFTSVNVGVGTSCNIGPSDSVYMLLCRDTACELLPQTTLVGQSWTANSMFILMPQKAFERRCRENVRLFFF